MRFRQQHFESADGLFQQLVVQGQNPKTLVVACCDSRVDPALVLDCEQRAIQGSLQNLMTSPWVSERVEQGTLILHGWYFDIGQLLRYNASTNAFESL